MGKMVFDLDKGKKIEFLFIFAFKQTKEHI